MYPAAPSTRKHVPSSSRYAIVDNRTGQMAARSYADKWLADKKAERLNMPYGNRYTVRELPNESDE